MEKATAVLVTAPEQAMTKEVTAIEARANAAVIRNEVDYHLADEWLSDIKAQQKKVKAFFEPMRKAAKEAYDSVLARRKEMMDPLESAEQTLKSKVSAYVEEQEAKRRAKEEELRRLAQEEANRKLEEAIAAEKSGDYAAAEFAMTDAEMLEDAAIISPIQTHVPKGKNISISKTWEIVSINEEEVPVSLNGAVIRPVDEGVVLRLIKASKGKIRIPGVTYKEVAGVSVRARKE